MDVSLIDAPHFREVAEWCIDYWKVWKDAPGDHIEDLYHSWSEGNSNKELVKAVHDFLDSLSKEYDRYEKDGPGNVPFLLDELASLMRTRQLQRLKEDMEYALSKGQVKKAEKLIRQHRTIKMGEGNGTNPLRADWSGVFSEPLDPVIRFEGDAGVFFNPAMTRDAFVVTQAPEKTGKTWILLEFIFRALMQRKKVAFFQVGDLSEKQVYMRMGVRWAARPLWKDQVGLVSVPSHVMFRGTKEANEEQNKKKRDQEIEETVGYSFRHKRIKTTRVVSERAVKSGIRRFKRAFGHAKGVDYLKVSVHPNSSINVSGIEGILEQWLLDEGFIPDVIVIDYADILAPEEVEGQLSERGTVNETWKALRRLSQKKHALVITATQADAKAYKQALQTRSNFSEDKRKLAHVTAIMGLNQTPAEKAIGGMRINWIALREAPFLVNRPLYVGTCFTLGRAICVAKLRGSHKKRKKRMTRESRTVRTGERDAHGEAPVRDQEV